MRRWNACSMSRGSAMVYPPAHLNRFCRLLNDFIRPLQQRLRNRQAKRIGRLEVDDELELRPAGNHWMTSSARSSNDCGMVSPRALAVLRLITSSNLLACSTGRSAGFAPFRYLSTYAAARPYVNHAFGL